MTFSPLMFGEIVEQSKSHTIFRVAGRELRVGVVRNTEDAKMLGSKPTMYL